MKRIRRFVPAAALFLLTVTVSAWAYDLPAHSFDLGTELSRFSYKEPGVMKQDGVLTGLTAAYRYAGDAVFMIEARAAAGDIDYTSVDTGDMQGIDDRVFEIRGLYGTKAVDTARGMLIPYCGLGYRYLNDDSQGMVTTTGARGYERQSNYYYIPVGMMAQAEMADGVRVGLTLEYDIFLKGMQVSKLSGAVAAYNDLRNDQDTGYGWRAAIPFKCTTADVDLVITPFIRYWKIERSDAASLTYAGVIVGFGYEPKNYSTEYGLNVSFRF